MRVPAWLAVGGDQHGQLVGVDLALPGELVADLGRRELRRLQYAHGHIASVPIPDAFVHALLAETGTERP